ncbi:sulfotransferase [Sphingorhabdus sp.]|uniref:sulfotransferase family protein n=1 Tax=Sphingorhabdus sp. TaxID=1902408 RepID=UPI0035947C35
MIKHLAGSATAFILPKCRFDRSIFIMGHMRCGSTALSNILCSHPQISGYGEAHIRYKSRSELGLLILNQIKRNSYRQNSAYLFDKILHSRYDSENSAEFFKSRVIFMIREPIKTIESIRNLFSSIGSNEYSNDGLASDYYEERICSLMANWEKFPPRHRIGISFEQLKTNPEKNLVKISEMIGLTPPLTNSYQQPKNGLGHGAGDPLTSHKYNKIISDDISTTSTDKLHQIKLPDNRLQALHNLYDEALATVTQV